MQNRLVLFYPTGHSAHAEPGHPERPQRVEAIRAALETAGVWDRLPRLEPVEVSREILTGIHTPEYLEFLETACQQAIHLDADTYTTPATWELALKAAGGGIAVTRAVWNREYNRGFALTRPPGHHATSNQGMGFCLLNNIAIAAEDLLRTQGANRLAIIDIDLHHGNGTQDIFWERGDVFYLSIHQAPLYPGTGLVNDIGAGAGKGTTANFPLPPGAGDQAFQTVLHELILPLLGRFVPEMVLVSVGFDPHWLDPLGHFQLSIDGYAHTLDGLIKWVDENCQGRTALFLEGGYDLRAAQAFSLATVDVLLERPWHDPIGPSTYPESQDWRKIVQRSHQIWGL